MGHDDLYQEAIKLLAKRDYSRQELATRLSTLVSDQGRVEAVINKLDEQGYLDDRGVADNILRQGLKIQHGPIRLRLSLRQKGIEQVVIDDALWDMTVDWLGMARTIRRRQFGLTAPLDEKSKAKLVRHLQHCGHSMDVIREVVEE